MKVSTRINGRVTSISLKPNICTLHYILFKDKTELSDLIKHSSSSPQQHIQDICYSLIKDWKGTSARGLSGFILDKLTEDICLNCLDVEPKQYKKIYNYFV